MFRFILLVVVYMISINAFAQAAIDGCEQDYGGPHVNDDFPYVHHAITGRHAGMGSSHSNYAVCSIQCFGQPGAMCNLNCTCKHPGENLRTDGLRRGAFTDTGKFTTQG